MNKKNLKKKETTQAKKAQTEQKIIISLSRNSDHVQGREKGKKYHKLITDKLIRRLQDASRNPSSKTKLPSSDPANKHNFSSGGNLQFFTPPQDSPECSCPNFPFFESSSLIPTFQRTPSLTLILLPDRVSPGLSGTNPKK